MQLQMVHHFSVYFTFGRKVGAKLRAAPKKLELGPDTVLSIRIQLSGLIGLQVAPYSGHHFAFTVSIHSEDRYLQVAVDNWMMMMNCIFFH